jgi:hypothetical protein
MTQGQGTSSGREKILGVVTIISLYSPANNQQEKQQCIDAKKQFPLPFCVVQCVPPYKKAFTEEP